MSRWPLLERFPKLATLPRAELREGPTPVQSLESIAPGLWMKRDDLTALPIGGNKVRNLEFLIGDVTPGDRVATVGSQGSTHALVTTIHARARGALVSLGLWPQEMNPMASIVAAELKWAGVNRTTLPNAPLAMGWLAWRRLRGDHAIPAGGTSPLGILGHVNGALELASQIREGLLPEPRQIIAPLGSGGTVAGLALGFAIAGMRPRIIAARVVPKIVGRKGRVKRLVSATAALIERVSGTRMPADPLGDVTIVESVYGGAYGRPLPAAEETAAGFESAIGLRLDSTYCAKTFAAAVAAADGQPTLFWLTFDARWIESKRGRRPDSA